MDVVATPLDRLPGQHLSRSRHRAGGSLLEPTNRRLCDGTVLLEVAAVDRCSLPPTLARQG